MSDKIKANEKTSLTVTGQFVDEEGDGLSRNVFDVLMLSIYLKTDRTRRIRSSDDVLDDGGFTIDGNGDFTWSVRPFETEILDPARVRIGSVELHVALFEFAWESPRAGIVADAFSTVTGSNLVTVTLPGHNLQARDNVYFMPTVDVGGLDLGGHYVIREVLNANAITVEHFDSATASVAGAGGPVEWFANGKAGSQSIEMQIRRVDPV